MEITADEKWAPVRGYEDLYEVSDHGRVRRLPGSYGPTGRQHFVNSGLLKGSPVTGGYLAASLYRDGRGRSRTFHTLVLEAFVGPPPEGMEGCHGNGIRTDNRLSNLRWDTKVGNSNDRRAHGTMFAGETHPFASLTDEQAIEARRLHAAGTHARDLAARFGMTYSGMEKVLTGETYGHLPVTEKARHGGAKLTAEQVSTIRTALASGSRVADVARVFGVSHNTVKRIGTGVSWAEHALTPSATLVPIARRPHHRAALTDDQVRAVRLACSVGADRHELAVRHGVTVGTIHKVARRFCYAHVAD